MSSEPNTGKLDAPGWVATPHGRFVLDGTWKNEFHLRDHLGNTRIALLESGSDSLAILQQNHYYPFGMLIPSLSTSNTLGALKDNRYLYNGKEFNDDFDLNWYDYGARFYDAQIARWHSVDPLAEAYISWTPYQYVRNNPIRRIDPNGMSDRDVNWRKENEQFDEDWKASDLALMGIQYNSPPGTSGGGGSRRRGEAVNDDLPVDGVVENNQSTIGHLSWEEISDKLIPVAYSVELNVGKEAGSATSTSPTGLIFVIRGPDRYKIRGFTSVGVGGGWLSVSATAHSIYYFYYGDIKNFDLTVFEGSAIDVEVTAGKGLVGGGIISITPNTKTQGEYLIGIGAVGGFGAGSPVSGSTTWQQTKLWWPRK